MTGHHSKVAHWLTLPLYFLLFGALQQAGFRQEIEWGLFDRDCVVTSALAVPCGDYGAFHFDVEATGSCQPRAAASEPTVLYPTPPPVQQVFATTPVSSPIGPTPRSRVVRAAIASSQPTTAPEAVTEARVTAIDWNDAHGAGVEYLLDFLSGPAIATDVFYLDDPALAPLGSGIGDQHLLAKLCEIAEEVDTASALPTLVVNMSFGRYPDANDPTPGAPCNENRLSCQITKVLDHLGEDDVLAVAAAGNHLVKTFPANQQQTESTGSMDLESFFSIGALQPNWESPADNDALFPSNALCVNGSVTSAGSSWSAAVFSGLYADTHWQLNLNRQLPEGVWSLGWWPAGSCVVLTKGEQLLPHCNDPVAAVVAGIVAGSASGCWSPAQPAASLEAQVSWQAEGQPAVPSLLEWVAAHHLPAPGSDPCIPCVDEDEQSARMPEGLLPGWIGGEGRMMLAASHTISPAQSRSGRVELASLEASPPQQPLEDLRINFTASAPLADVCLDSVFLRSGGRFHRVQLTDEGLTSLTNGESELLVLRGAQSLISPGEQPSLFFVFSHDSGAGCATAAVCPDEACFWTSTSILLF